SVMSRTAVGSTPPSRMATTRPTRSAMYSASSPDRMAIAIGAPSSLAICTSLTWASERSGEALSLGELDGEAAGDEGEAETGGGETVEPPPPPASALIAIG